MYHMSRCGAVMSSSPGGTGFCHRKNVSKTSQDELSPGLRTSISAPIGGRSTVLLSQPTSEVSVSHASYGGRNHHVFVLAPLHRSCPVFFSKQEGSISRR